MSYLRRSGFTIIEVMVVIAIIAIVSTIGWFALQGYSSSARDSARISDLKAIRKSLDVYIPYHGTLPFPDEASSVRFCLQESCLTGTVQEIGVQWPLQKDIISLIGFQGQEVDPIDHRPYTYLLSKNGRAYELMAFLEDPSGILENNISSSTFPDSLYSKRYPYLSGNKLGVLVSSMSGNLNMPVQYYLSGAINLATLTGVVALISNQPGDLVTSPFSGSSISDFSRRFFSGADNQ